MLPACFAVLDKINYSINVIHHTIDWGNWSDWGLFCIAFISLIWGFSIWKKQFMHQQKIKFLDELMELFYKCYYSLEGHIARFESSQAQLIKKFSSIDLFQINLSPDQMIKKCYSLLNPSYKKLEEYRNEFFKIKAYIERGRNMEFSNYNLIDSDEIFLMFLKCEIIYLCIENIIDNAKPQENLNQIISDDGIKLKDDVNQFFMGFKNNVAEFANKNYIILYNQQNISQKIKAFLKFLWPKSSKVNSSVK